ncbi:MAG: IS66 family insertion sequence element accessory protein TnpA [Candidatus Acidiferrales bacterium]
MTERECATGRRRYRSRGEAEQLAAEFEASGLTQPEFCQRHDVSGNTLARYLKRYRQQNAPRNETPRWLAVEIAVPTPAASGLTVVVGAGRRIEVGRGFDAVTLEQLLSALERR